MPLCYHEFSDDHAESRSFLCAPKHTKGVLGMIEDKTIFAGIVNKFRKHNKNDLQFTQKLAVVSSNITFGRAFLLDFKYDCMVPIIFITEVT